MYQRLILHIFYKISQNHCGKIETLTQFLTYTQLLTYIMISDNKYRYTVPVQVDYLYICIAVYIYLLHNISADVL